MSDRNDLASLTQDADAEELRADILDILEHLPLATILGPDQAGFVWLTGRTRQGAPLRVMLGRAGDVIADAALGWRLRRGPRY